jgi:hypothetical protein
VTAVGLFRGGTKAMSRRGSAGLGLAVAVVTVAVYQIGSGRSLDYDSSLTVGAFVKTPSLFDPFRRQIQLNNHPLFSVLEHIVWSLGFHSETSLRVLPIVFGALTVALITAWCARCWGLLSGLSAGAVLATNPMFADLSRAVRGYSLLAMCAVASTLLLWQLLQLEPEHRSRAMEIAYVVFVAAGIATHLYGSVVLIVHAAIVALRHELDATWMRRWVAGGFFGGLVDLKTIQVILNTDNERTFHDSFPRELTTAMLGQARVAVVVLTLVVGCALWMGRSRKEILGAVAAVLGFAALVWLVVQPQFLVVRYLIWLIPGVALAAAFVVARRPVAVVLVGVAVVAMVSHQWSSWTAIQVPTSETAAVVDAARAQGMRVCGLLHTGVAVLAYTRQPDRPKTLTEFARCDVVLGFYVTRAADRLERKLYPYAWTIPGQYRAFIYSRKPEATVTAGMTRKRLDLETHPRTWPR